MKLTYNTNLSRWEAICSFQEKDIPKNAGFRWDMNVKRWHTSTPDVAAKFDDVADQDALAALEAVKDKIKASSAAQIVGGLDIPAPDGKQYFPYQQAGINFALNHSGVLIGDEMEELNQQCKNKRKSPTAGRITSVKNVVTRYAAAHCKTASNNHNAR